MRIERKWNLAMELQFPWHEPSVTNVYLRHKIMICQIDNTHIEAATNKLHMFAAGLEGSAVACDYRCASRILSRPFFEQRNMLKQHRPWDHKMIVKRHKHFHDGILAPYCGAPVHSCRRECVWRTNRRSWNGTVKMQASTCQGTTIICATVIASIGKAEET